jgi:two-component system nitrate/nitrite response regulator NarL
VKEEATRQPEPQSMSGSAGAPRHRDDLQHQAPPSLRFAIVCAIRLYREGLADILERQEGFDVVFAGADEWAAVDFITDQLPDIALFDMAMLDSTNAVRSISEMAAGVKVVALAVPETEPHVLACAEAGIAGYVPRDASIHDLIATVRSVARGETTCSPVITAGLMRRVAALARRPMFTTGRRLTGREMQIIELIGEGLSNKQIARRLNIELPTVKNHVHNILGKLSLNSRVEAVVAWNELRASLNVRQRARSFR